MKSANSSASSRAPSPPTRRTTSSASVPLTSSEIEQLRRDKQRVAAQLKGAFSDWAPPKNEAGKK